MNTTPGPSKAVGRLKAAALFGTPSGSYPSTVVEYASGFRVAASKLAHTLGVPGKDVKALPSSTEPLAAGAKVVVIVGASAAGAQSASDEEQAASGESAEAESAESQADEGTEAGTEETASEPGA